MYYLEEAQWLL